MLAKIPTPLKNFPNKAMTNDAQISKTDFKAYSLLFIAVGIQIKAIAKIKPVLAVTLPTAFPIAISTNSGLLCVLADIAANNETNNSGSVVARLTIVAPTINLGIPDISAN